MKKRRILKKILIITILEIILLTYGINILEIGNVNAASEPKLVCVAGSSVGGGYAIDENNILWELWQGHISKGVAKKIGEGYNKVSECGGLILALKGEDLYSMGINNYGQAGNGTTDYIENMTYIRSGFKEISANENHGVAIDMDGNIWSWGAGYIVNGQGENIKFPIQLTTGEKFKKIEAGIDYTLALDEKRKYMELGL